MFKAAFKALLIACCSLVLGASPVRGGGGGTMSGIPFSLDPMGRGQNADFWQQAWAELASTFAANKGNLGTFDLVQIGTEMSYNSFVHVGVTSDDYYIIATSTHMRCANLSLPEPVFTWVAMPTANGVKFMGDDYAYLIAADGSAMWRFNHHTSAFDTMQIVGALGTPSMCVLGHDDVFYLSDASTATVRVVGIVDTTAAVLTVLPVASVGMRLKSRQDDVILYSPTHIQKIRNDTGVTTLSNASLLGAMTTRDTVTLGRDNTLIFLRGYDTKSAIVISPDDAISTHADTGIYYKAVPTTDNGFFLVTPYANSTTDTPIVTDNALVKLHGYNDSNLTTTKARSYACAYAPDGRAVQFEFVALLFHNLHDMDKFDTASPWGKDTIVPNSSLGYSHVSALKNGDTAINQIWLEVENPPIVELPKIYSKNKIREQLIATPTPQGITASASDAFNGLLQQAGFLNVWLDAAYLKSDNPAVLALRASPELTQLLAVYGLNLDTLLQNAEDETWRVVDNGGMF